MKVIIAGSRTLCGVNLVRGAVQCALQFGIEVSRIIHGGAKGIDTSAAEWASEEMIPRLVYLPDWNKEPKAAAFIRNEAMGREADALIAIWDGWSGGTKHMISVMERFAKPLFVVRVSYLRGLPEVPDFPPPQATA